MALGCMATAHDAGLDIPHQIVSMPFTCVSNPDNVAAIVNIEDIQDVKLQHSRSKLTVIQGAHTL